MPSLEARIRAKAQELWRADGRPDGGPDAYRDQAIKDNTAATLEPNPLGESAAPDEAEPLQAVENLGEQPNLTDQGQTCDYPLPRGERTGRPSRSAHRETKGAKP
jgi:hypothetical protein